jgi:transposase
MRPSARLGLIPSGYRSGPPRPYRSVPPEGHPKVTPVKYVGIDVHKRLCQAAVLDEDGSLLDETRFPNDPDGIEEFAGKLTSFRDEVRAVVESTGNLWIPIHDRLEERGIDVTLSNPSKTKIISEAKVKTDKRDARMLARLLKADLLYTCYVPGGELRSRRELLRHRLDLVKMRTAIRNRVHALLDKHCLRMPGATPFSGGSVKWLRGLHLGFMDDAVLSSDLALLEVLDAQVGAMEDKIAAVAAEDRRVRLLMTMTGVGYFTALLVLSEVGDVSRFRGCKEFASWMGLAPSVHQSGERAWTGSVRGPGNRRLRWAMVEAAQTAVRHDPRLGGMYEKVSRRGGKACAAVAVAHEMAMIMYFMLVRGEPYRDSNRALTERKLKSLGKRAFDGLRN